MDEQQDFIDEETKAEIKDFNVSKNLNAETEKKSLKLENLKIEKKNFFNNIYHF